MELLIRVSKYFFHYSISAYSYHCKLSKKIMISPKTLECLLFYFAGPVVYMIDRYFSQNPLPRFYSIIFNYL